MQQDLWRDLAARVRSFSPDVVVLVARKMPRLREALGFEFRTNALEITDLAIPFCHSILHGARVAIVDDVINRGSTMRSASKQVIACGARSVAFFSLARTEQSDLGEQNVFCSSVPMSKRDVLRWAMRVPEALRLVNKPFDLSFPVIPCDFAPGVTTGSEIFNFLVDTTAVLNRTGFA